jgi:hypothetical protein
VGVAPCAAELLHERSAQGYHYPFQREHQSLSDDVQGGVDTVCSALPLCPLPTTDFHMVLLAVPAHGHGRHGHGLPQDALPEVPQAHRERLCGWLSKHADSRVPLRERCLRRQERKGQMDDARAPRCRKVVTRT